AIKLTDKKMGSLCIVINGAGAAGIAIAKLLLKMEFGEVILSDINGIVYLGRKENDTSLEDIAKLTNPQQIRGNLATALQGADVFVGVSAPNIVSKEMIRSMNTQAIVFPMANPTPEIMREDALSAGAFIVGTGRSDYPNQINNVLAFPGVFRGALDVRASCINEEMKVSAAYAIAQMVSSDQLKCDYIIPSPLDKNVAKVVAKAVAQAARDSRVARI
ncbi:MAG: malic enzyme-like NAD(P)-binding protein, partial [Longicatena sp.]